MFANPPLCPGAGGARIYIDWCFTKHAVIPGLGVRGFILTGALQNMQL